MVIAPIACGYAAHRWSRRYMFIYMFIYMLIGVAVGLIIAYLCYLAVHFLIGEYLVGLRR